MKRPADDGSAGDSEGIDLPRPATVPFHEVREFQTTTLLEAALMCARNGWHILPLFGIVGGRCECDDTQCKPAGKHPHIEEWESRASCNEAQIRKWWTRWPNANIGWALGATTVVRSTPTHAMTAMNRSRALKPRWASSIPRGRKPVGGVSTTFRIHLRLCCNPVLRRLGPIIPVLTLKRPVATS